MPAENLNADAKAIFWEALEITSRAQRDAYVQRACEGNPSLLKRVEKLLAAQSRSDSFLDPPIELTLDATTASPQPGAQIGPYKLREQIGEGGMGSFTLPSRSSR